MGSTAFVVISELAMQNIEKQIINNPNNNSEIILWKKYVDYCLAIIKTAYIDSIFEYINALNENIEFTVERELNNSISYLDVKIMRQINGELKFKDHRKPISNDRYLNKVHPINRKVTTVKALQRAYTICSDDESKAEELNTVRKYLLNDGYPIHLIDKCDKRFIYCLFYL